MSSGGLKFKTTVNLDLAVISSNHLSSCELSGYKYRQLPRKGAVRVKESLPPILRGLRISLVHRSVTFLYTFLYVSVLQFLCRLKSMVAGDITYKLTFWEKSQVVHTATATATAFLDPVHYHIHRHLQQQQQKKH